MAVSSNVVLSSIHAGRAGISLRVRRVVIMAGISQCLIRVFLVKVLLFWKKSKVVNRAVI